LLASHDVASALLLLLYLIRDARLPARLFFWFAFLFVPAVSGALFLCLHSSLVLIGP